MSERIGSRVVEVDIVKAFTIIMVVLGHISSPFSSFIYSWHMPMFFFLSGFFIRVDNLSAGKFTQKELKRLLPTYLLFGLLGIVTEAIKNVALHRGSLDYLDALFGLFFWMDTNHLHHYGFVLWFLPALFWAKVSTFILLKRYRSNLFAITGITLCIYFIVTHSTILLPFALDKGLSVVIWTALGWVYYQNLFSVCNNFSVAYLGVIIIPLLFIQHPHLDIASKTFANPAYNLVYSIFIILIIMRIASALKTYAETTIIKLFAKHTLLVMVAHVYTNNMAHVVVEKYLGGFWMYKLLISLSLLYLLIGFKEVSDMLVKKMKSNHHLSGNETI